MCVFLLKLVELKEAEEKSLKESERLEKEIADVQELKVIEITTSIFQFYEIEKSLIHCLF
jgi:F-type H+-transporting ATPase subunit d